MVKVIWRKWNKLKAETEPLCGVDIPTDGLPPVSWYCAKLNMSSTNLDELSALNGNCPGCIEEAHNAGLCKSNPHRNMSKVFVNGNKDITTGQMKWCRVKAKAMRDMITKAIIEVVNGN